MAKRVGITKVEYNDKIIGYDIQLDNGKDFRVLNPHGRYVKATKELDKKVKLTNKFEEKIDDKGKKMRLTQKDIGYNNGVRSILIEEAKIHKAKNKKK